MNSSPLRHSLGGTLAGLALLTFGTPATAQIANGGFETNYASWTTTGSALIATSAFGDNPTQGNKQALLSNDSTAGDYGSGSKSASALETALSINAGALSGLGNGTANNGSGIAQSFTILTPQSMHLSFSYDFLTSEDPSFPPFNPDFAFVSISSTSVPAARSVTRFAQVSDATLSETLSPGPPSPTAGDFLTETGYHTFLFQKTLLAGTYSLGFGVVNANTGDIGSALLLDNVQAQLVPVPEMGTSLSLVLLCGLGLLSCVKRRICPGA